MSTYCQILCLAYRHSQWK